MVMDHDVSSVLHAVFTQKCRALAVANWNFYPLGKGEYAEIVG